MRAGQVIGDRTRHPGVPEQGGDIMGAGFGPALEFADDNLPMIDMVDYARLNAVETNEAQTAEDLFDWKELGKLLFIAEAIL